MGPWLSWLELAAHNRLVVGSNPTGPTMTPTSVGVFLFLWYVFLLRKSVKSFVYRALRPYIDKMVHYNNLENKKGEGV